MCTIVVAVAVWPESALVLAANRDEMLDRAAEPAWLRAAGELGERAVLAPRDVVGGGSWLGLGDRELVVAITNRRSLAARVPGRPLRSRGELVAMALGAGERPEARARIAGLDPRDYNSFHLLLADRSGAEVLWSDGRQFNHVVLDRGVHWVTERSFGAGPSLRHERLDETRGRLLAEPEPSIEGWRSILADHRPYAPLGQLPPDDQVGLDSMCVHARPIGYGTRSSTVIRLGRSLADVEFHHAPRRPCEAAFVDLSDDARRLLAGHGGASDASGTAR
jgi:uncharacterized protein with NRDE domain